MLRWLASKASARGIPAVLVSHDKDLYQLVDTQTTIYNPLKGLYLDEQGVLDTFGVRPDQVVDVLALWGDSSDNIPGVVGIGEKTAKALIQEYGNLDSLLERLPSVKNPRVGARERSE